MFIFIYKKKKICFCIGQIFGLPNVAKIVLINIMCTVILLHKLTPNQTIKMWLKSHQ